MHRCILVFLLSLTSIAAAGSISVQGQASAPADRAVLLFYMKAETKPDGSAEQALATSWGTTKQWLINFGIKETQITLRESSARMFNDQKKYLIQKIAVTMKLDPSKSDGDLDNIAQLVDQSAARGMLPAAQLMTVAQDQDPISAAGIPDAPNHFVFFLPADQSKLAQDALVDAYKRAQDQYKSAAAAAKIPVGKIKSVSADSTAQILNIRLNQIGIASTSLPNVRAVAPLSIEYETDNKAAQSISATGLGRIDLPAEQAMIQSRLAVPDSNMQKALDRMADRAKQFQSKAAAAQGAKVEMGGIVFFAGNPGAFMVNGEMNEGQIPMGVYRDARIVIDRLAGETEPDFRKRVEKLATSLHPGATPDSPNFTDNPYFQLTWGPKDQSQYMDKAIAAAIVDATENAKRVIAASGGKLGAILDMDSSPIENPVIGNPYLQNMQADFSRNQEYLTTATRLGEKPALNLNVNIRFAAEIP